MYYALNVDCSKTKTNGDLNGYFYDPTNPISTANNPKGQVWWKSNDQQNWAPVAATDPKKQGDPKHVSPVITNGDSVWIALRDDQNNPISSVIFAIVFGKRGATPGQAPIASPFQNATAGATYDQTTFTATVISQRSNDGFYVIQFPAVTYPGGGSNNVNFGYYVGASVTYGDGTVREFGMDPEMDVSDYAGSTR
jgi:hypothetical protein